MSKGKRIPAGEALDAVQPLIDALGPEARIAGSLRRGKPTVRDVDVVIPRPVNKTEVLPFGEWVQGGEKKIRLNVPNKATLPVKSSVQVDIVICPPEEFGACLMYLTGPHNFNIQTRGRAKGLGLKLNEKGVWKPVDEEDADENNPAFSFDKKTKQWWQRIAGKSEKEVFAALGLKYSSPAGREKLVSFAGEVAWETVVIGSKGNQYNVKLFADGKWQCECKGFKYRRTCGHIEKNAKPQYEQEKVSA